MFCVNFVLMKMESHFNFISLLMFFEKTFSENYSHILIFAVISYCFKYFCLFSVKIVRNVCKKNLSVVYANDTMLGDACLNDYFSSESIFFK